MRAGMCMLTDCLPPAALRYMYAGLAHLWCATAAAGYFANDVLRNNYGAELVLAADPAGAVCVFLSIRAGACMAGSSAAAPAWQRHRWPSCLGGHRPADAGFASIAAADAAARVAAGEGVAHLDDSTNLRPPGNLQLVTALAPLLPTPYAIAVRKGNTALADRQATACTRHGHWSCVATAAAPRGCCPQRQHASGLLLCCCPPLLPLTGFAATLHFAPQAFSSPAPDGNQWAQLRPGPPRAAVLHCKRGAPQSRPGCAAKQPRGGDRQPGTRPPWLSQKVN